MIYTHVLNQGGKGVASPLDALPWQPTLLLVSLNTCKQALRHGQLANRGRSCHCNDELFIFPTDQANTLRCMHGFSYTRPRMMD